MNSGRVGSVQAPPGASSGPGMGASAAQARAGGAAGPGIAFLAAAVLLFGTSYWPTAIAGDHVAPTMLAALRTLPAALLLAGAVPLVGGRLPRGRNLLWSGLTGLLMVGVFFYGVTEGTVKAGAGNASVLGNISPFFVVILGRLLLSERISPLRAGGLIIGFSGVVMMVWTQLGAKHASDLPLGIVLASAAALAWAVGTLVLKWIVAREPQLDLVGFTAGQFAFGGAALLAVAFATDGTGGTQWGSAGAWGPLAYLIIGNSALGALAYFAALKRISATRASTGLFLVPVVAVIVEIARGNSPTALVGAGMALAIAGVAVVNLPPVAEWGPLAIPRRNGRMM